MSGSTSWLPNNWNWRAAGNLTFGATGAGLAGCAAASELLTERSQWPAELLAVLLVAAGFGLAWQKGGSLRQQLAGAFGRNSSWAAREMAIAPVLILALLVAAVLGSRLLSLLVLALAGGLLYAQSQILQGSDGVAAWRGKQLVPVILATGFAEGAGVLTFIDTLLDPASMPQAVRLAIVLVVVRWPLWGAYRDTLIGAPLPDGTKAALRRFNTQFLAFGLAAPIVALTAGVLTPAFGGPLAALGGLLAVAGGWLLKTMLFDRGALTPGIAMPRVVTPAAAAPKPKQEEIQA